MAKIYLSFDNNVISENAGQLKSINVYHGHFYISQAQKLALMQRLSCSVLNGRNAAFRQFLALIR